jgi:hypothetical protein
VISGSEDDRPPVEVMVAFIDAHRVEPICGVLPIAPSTYNEHLAKRADPRGSRIVRAGTRLCAPRSFGFSKRTGGSTVSGRFGGSLAARASMSRDARWRG